MVRLFCRAGLADKTREHRPPPAAEAGFLQQLAARRGLDVLAVVDHPGRDFVVHGAEPGPVLAHEHQIVVLGHGDDVDPGRKLGDPVVGDLAPGGQAEVVMAQHQPGWPAEEILLREALPGQGIVRELGWHGRSIQESAKRPHASKVEAGGISGTLRFFRRE